jgi:hypothetical protein
VMGETHEWSRNEGDGFGLPQTLPAWFPELDVGAGHLIIEDAAVLSVSGTQQQVISNGLSSTHPPPPAEINAGAAAHSQRLAVMDVDGDGLPDVVDRRDEDAPTVTYSGRSVDDDGVLLSGGTRPGLLLSVELGEGASTLLSYRPSTELEPSGTDAAHTTRSRKDVLTALEVLDPVTGFGARQQLQYHDGVTSHGRWLGFGTVRQDEYVWEPDLATGQPASAWEWLGATSTTYDLDRDHQLPIARLLWTDQAADWVTGLGIVENERLSISWSYEDQGTGAAFARWPDSITAVERSEVRTNLLLPVVERSLTVSTEYDAAGNVTLVRLESPQRPEDTVEERTTWVADGSGAWWVPRERSTWSVDPNDPAQLVNVERGSLLYDEGGLQDLPSVGAITGQQVCGGLARPCATRSSSSSGSSSGRRAARSRRSQLPRGATSTSTPTASETRSPSSRRTRWATRAAGTSIGGAGSSLRQTPTA